MSTLDTLTGILALATTVLAVATWLLWRATRLLASKTEEDFRRRKTQETVLAWERIRDLTDPNGLPHLTSNDPLSEAMRPILRKIEHFAACINADVYDFEIFVRLSGGWFRAQYGNIAAYVTGFTDQRTYADMKTLYDKVLARRAGGGVLPQAGD